MVQCTGPLPARLRDAFVDAVARASGSILDVHVDERRVIARSLLPQSLEVRKDSCVQVGVALHAHGFEVCVHPYAWCEDCRGGAIVARTLYTERVDLRDEDTEGHALDDLQEAVRVCCISDGVMELVAGMRLAAKTPVDPAYTLLPIISRVDPRTAATTMRQIIERYRAAGDATLFGLTRAVMTTAGDCCDPEVRWRLEEFAGALAAVHSPPKPLYEQSREVPLHV